MRIHTLLSGTIAAFLTALCAQAQGTLAFGNYFGVGDSRVDAPVFDEDGVTRLEGTAFLTQLYVATQPAALAAVGEPRPFRTGTAAGYVARETVVLPGIPGGTRVYVEMRAWAAAAGPTYEVALASGGKTGASEAFSVICGNAGSPPTVPTDLVGLKSFSLHRIQGVKIVTQPLSQTVPMDAAVTFGVAVEGTEPLSFQWFKNGSALAGANGASLALAKVAVADAGTYFVRVSNPWSTADSAGAVLSVLLPPGLASQPAPQTVIHGQTLTLQVTPTGSSPFEYQWRFNGADLAGATQAILTVPDFNAALAGNYTVVVRNAVGVFESDPIAVAVAYSLAVDVTAGGTAAVEPQAASYPANAGVRLTATADDGFAFQGWDGDVTSTANPLKLTITTNVSVWAGFSPINGTVYFNNLFGAAGIDAPIFDVDGETRLAGNAFLAQLYGGASAETLHAVGRPVPFGTDARAGYFDSDLSLIRAVPPVPLNGRAFVQVRAWETAAGETYEEAWLAGGKAGVSQILTVTTGGGGIPPSLPANLVGLESFALTRAVAPGIEQPPTDATFIAGQAGSLAIVATGTPPLAYQWLKEGAELPEATASTLSFAAVTPAEAGEYTVRVSNPWGEITSDTVTLTVLVPPAIQNLPLEVPVPFGGNAELTVAATGSAPLAYQWFAGAKGDTTNPVGTGQPTLALVSVVAPASYWVRVSNAAGVVDSETVFVTTQQQPQTIEFPPIADHVFGDGPFAIAATASSGLPVTLAVTSGPAIIEGHQVTLTGAGTVVLTATQAGGGDFLPAEPVTRSFNVAKATATISLAGLTQVYDGTPRLVTATTTPAGLAVQVTYNGSPTPPVNAGTFAVSAVIVDANYQGTTATSLIVAKASQTLSFGPLPARVFGDAPFAVSASSSAGLPVTLVVLSGPATLAGGLVTATGTGTVTLRASQAGNFNYQPAQVEGTFTVGKASAVVQLSGLVQNYDGLPKTVQVTTQPAGLTVVTTYDGNAQPPVEAGTHAVRAVVADENYEGEAKGTLTILARISGLVFEDEDGNGRRDPGEAALASVTVRLFEVDGTTSVGTAVSATDGSFAFSGLAAQAFVVEETDPEGFGSTTPNRRTVNLAGLSQVEVVFGDQRQGMVSGLVFIDANGNGLRDPGEAGLPGVQVSLNSVPARDTTTGADGSYAFTDVPSGSYTVTEVDLAGYTSTTPNQRGVNLGAGGATASFGDRLAGVVSGTVFEDLNGDGNQGNGEAGLARVTVRLDGPGGARSAETDDAGQYAFTQLEPGTYEVEEADPAGYVSSTSNRRTVVINEAAAATASFGDQRLGGISGLVFDDVNGNGQRDLSESGLGGVLITLSGGATDVTTRTDTDGSYRFDPPAAGLYTVTEADPAGFVSTTPNLRQVNVGALSAAVANFGDQAVGRIAGTVFDDLNGNGALDSGEPGLGGVEIQLIGASAVWLAQTAGNGGYAFDAVEAGAYTVIETDPPGFTSSTPNNRQVVLAAGGSASANFGDQQVGTIAGRVFDDLNGNALFEAGEPGIAAVTVTLGGAGRNLSIQTTGDGSYAFTGLPAGVYTVAETDPAGFTSSSPGERIVSLAPGGAATVNFADQPLQTIVGSVFEDQNGNGRQDAGEPGIADVQVELVKQGTEDVLATTVTSASGSFAFVDLLPGNYLVRQVVPTGYTVASSTSPSLAGPRRRAAGTEQSIVIEEGGAGSAAFANLVIGSLTGAVFEDMDGNGALDSTEPGIGGVLVQLFAVGGTTPLQTTLTAGNGAFVFAGLAPQTYEVRQTTPAGFYSASAVFTVTIKPGSAATANFANQRVGAISGRVYHDENGNGIADPVELGIGGVAVTLSESGGLPVTTTTSGDGSFVFSGLVPGEYTVTESDPEGFSSSTPNQVQISLVAGQAGGVSFGDLARPAAPPALAIHRAQDQSGAWVVVLTGETGRTYVIESTADFITWKLLLSGRAVGGQLQATDAETSGAAARFYRARVGP